MLKTNKLIKQKKLAQLHNLANLGHLAAGIFHDLINPLNAITLNLSQAQLDNHPLVQKTKKYIDQANTAALHMQSLLSNIKEQLRDQDKKVNFNLEIEIDKIIKIIDYQFKKEQINIILNIDHQLMIYGSKIKFNRVLTNLLINAIEACIKGKGDKKEIMVIAKKKQGKKIVQIIDNGCGIPDYLKKDLFKPFFSNNGGLGLGLNLSQKIIKKDFKGQIKIINKTNSTIFEIDLNC